MLRNFGMPRPEGYRKARRLFDLAERFRRPVLIFIDTPGAYPGIGAEERGQAEAIAMNLEVMSSLSVPSISVVIGEGASGGALGLGVTNRILMLQYAWYNVISPESCSSILYRDPSQGKKSAEALKLTAKDLAGFGITDEIIEEPEGGAHRERRPRGGERPRRDPAPPRRAEEAHPRAARRRSVQEVPGDGRVHVGGVAGLRERRGPSGANRRPMPLVPPHVASLTPYVPGKPIEEVEREYGVSNVAKLASNENASVPRPRAGRRARGRRQGPPLPRRRRLPAPQRDRREARRPAEEVMVGNGSNELIELLVRTFVLDDEEVLTSGQSFVAYKLAAQEHGRSSSRRR